MRGFLSSGLIGMFALFLFLLFLFLLALGGGEGEGCVLTTVQVVQSGEDC